MPDVITVFLWEGWAFLLAVSAILALQLLNGDIYTRGLLDFVRPSGQQLVSAGRVQLLIVTGVLATQYLSQVWNNPHKFPDIPANWLVFFGGSQLIYLGAKYRTLSE